MSLRSLLRHARRLACVAFLAAAALPAAAQAPIPSPQARVTDLTGTLPAARREALEQRLAAFEARKGSQVAVLVVASTRPEEIDQYAVRAFEQWKLGRKGIDDGVLLVVAREDRRLRIEVGYGLEGVIPDSVAARIVSETIVPRFRADDYAGGIEAGVEQVLRLIEGEKLPPRSGPGAGQTSGRTVPGLVDMLSELALPLVMLVFFLTGVFRLVFGRFGGAVLAAVLAGVLAGLLLSVLAGVLAAFAAFVITYMNGLVNPAVFGGGRGRHGGGWGAGGGWGSGGGFGGSGGGWSGGGGSSGGGGASGSW